MRREIPIGDEADLSGLPSTRNTQGSYFSEMGSSFGRYDNDRLIIKSKNHSFGYIRTSRGIPQSETTEAIEELEIENKKLRVTHTYIDASSRTTLQRQGVTFERLEVGEKIIARGRKGRRNYTMYLQSIDFEDGTTFIPEPDAYSDR